MTAFIPKQVKPKETKSFQTFVLRGHAFSFYKGNPKDTSVDTHIDATYVRHLSSLTSADYVRFQMSAITDDGHMLHQYGCLRKLLCKCREMKLIGPLCEK